MKIGIFDSGLGGLIVAQSLIANIPEYDYVYLGDTARVPYGNRSQQIIYEFTRAGVEYLLKQDCQLVIIACNTASAEALRSIQQNYLPQYYPDRRVLGVLIPAAEAAANQTANGKIGVIATQGTVSSKAYERELQKINPQITLLQQAAPLLVPLVENNALKYASPILDDYLAPLVTGDIDTLVLGCTHYPLLKDMIRSKVGSLNVISQDEIIPEKLQMYLSRHSEIEGKLSRNSSSTFYMTDIAPSTQEVATLLFGKPVDLKKVTL